MYHQRPCKRISPLQGLGVFNPHRRMLLYSGAWRIGSLGARYPLASLFPSMDVRGDDGAQLSEKSVGTFHRNLCRWFVGLHKYFCHHLLFQWIAPAYGMGSHRLLGSARFIDCGACVVFKPPGCWRVCLGLFSAANKISRRCAQVRGQLRADDRFFRPRYGSVSTALSQPLSSNVAPVSTLIGATAGSPSPPGVPVPQTSDTPASASVL